MSDLNKKRHEFIIKLIPFVLEQGWNAAALEAVSVSISDNKAYHGTLFENLSSVVDYFEYMEDLRMLEEVHLGKEDSIRGKISMFLQFRIKELSGGKDMWLRLREFYFGPKCISHLPTNFWNTSDKIWTAIGDRSADINYYTKRLLLSSVYASSIRYYLSNKHKNIDVFITSSLDRIVKIASYKKYLKLPKLEDIPILRLFS